jgi:hypothetical protein
LANFVKITFAGDTKSLEAALGRADTAAEKTSKTFKQKLATSAKAASAAILGGLAVAAKIGFGELQDAQKVGAQTAAVIKSTGGAAKVTAGQVADLSAALMQKSGIDDELIQSGANVVLTFKNIRDEAGKGNDIFSQTTKVALDMSVALGQDMKSSAILVGKAINDPIRGLTALTRVGVTFTEAQKKQIKAMAEAGDTAGAQKIILKELQSEFGGSAEAAGKTLAGQLSLAKETFNNLAGSIVGAVLPAFNSFSGILNKVLGWLSKHETTTKLLVGVLGGLAAGVWAVNAATKAWAATQKVLNLAMKANPMGLVITAVIALGAALVLAYKKSETFRDIVNGALNAVKTVVETLGTAAGTVIDGIKTAFDGLMTFLKDWGVLLLGPVGVIIRCWDSISDGMKTVKEKVGGFLGDVVTFVKDLPGKIAGALVEPFKPIRTAAETAAGAVKTAFDKVVTFFSGLAGRIKTALVNIGTTIAGPFQAAYNAIPAPIRALLEGRNPFSGGPTAAERAAVAAQGTGYVRGTVPHKHSGGIVPGPRGAPTAIMALGGERVLSPGQSRGGGDTYHIHVGPGQDGAGVVKAIKEYVRRNGPLVGVAA